MKNTYVVPELNIDIIEVEDIITDSSNFVPGNPEWGGSGED